MFDNLTAGNVMSSPAIVLDSNETIAMAWEMLRGQPFGHLVITNAGTIIGLIDARRLLAASSPTEEAMRRLRPISRILARNTTCVTANASLAVVIKLMARYHCDAVPVASLEGRPLGIVTAADIISTLSEHLRVSEQHSTHHKPGLEVSHTPRATFDKRSQASSTPKAMAPPAESTDK